MVSHPESTERYRLSIPPAPRDIMKMVGAAAAIATLLSGEPLPLCGGRGFPFIPKARGGRRAYPYPTKNYQDGAVLTRASMAVPGRISRCRAAAGNAHNA